MPYCLASDLIIGDVPLQAPQGDGSPMISRVSELMDAQLGKLYTTPINISVDNPDQRPGALMLKQINLLVASGRILMDAKAAGDDIQAYGNSLFLEGMGYLQAILSGQYDLEPFGAIKPEEESKPNVSVSNQDPVSLIEAFYINSMQGHNWWYPNVPPTYVAPYGPYVGGFPF